MNNHLRGPSSYAERFSDHGHFLANHQIVRFEQVSTRADESHRLEIDWETLDNLSLRATSVMGRE
jgi:hypothetical protein